MKKCKLLKASKIITGKLDANAAQKKGVYPFFTCSKEPDRISYYDYDMDAIILAGNNAQGNFHICRYNGKFNAYQRTYIITAKDDYDVDYLKYSIENALKHLKKISQGSQTKFLTTSILNDFEINQIDKSDQTNLIKILKKIDKRIEINNSVNDKLHEMAKTLYDYWFTQFDFPDKNGKPYKSSGGKMVYNEQLKKEIPEGWEVKNVSDLLEVVTGKEDANFSKENGLYDFFTCSTQTLKCDEYAFDGEAILIAGNGDFNVKHYSGKFNAYQRTYVLMPNNKLFRAPIYFVANQMINSFKRGSNGSIVKFITKGDIENIKILIPHDLNLYDSLNSNLYLIEKNNLEIEKLTRLRDFLLPMLMNGQATVCDNIVTMPIKENVTVYENIIKDENFYNQRFDMWLSSCGVAARGDIDKATLREIFDAMDEDDK